MGNSRREVVKFSIILFLVSIFILFLLDLYVEPNFYEISDLSSNNLGEIVLIEGEILEQRLVNNNLFLRIGDSNSAIKGVIFDIDSEFDLHRNYSFLGKISYYDNDLEILVSEVKELD